jgi:hypothetical protein
MMSANNHILNAAGMTFFSKIFGVNEFALRIPSLLAHGLFLYYSGRLVLKCRNKWLAVFGFLIINLNPYMIDFFSLARGYGLSIGLMIASIYYLFVFIEKDGSKKNSTIAMFFAAFAVLANFVLLNYFVVLFGSIVLLNIYFLKKNTSLSVKNLLKSIALPVVVILSLFGLIIPIALDLKAAGALYFGGSRGFWADTICTIIDRSFYEQPYAHYMVQRAVKAFVVLSCFFGFVYVLTNVFKKKDFDKSFLFLAAIVFLLFLTSLSTIVQFYTLDTLFLTDRTVLFLVVLFNIFLVFLYDQLLKKEGLTIYIAGVLASIMVLHFAKCLNLIYVLEWKYDANTKEMLSDISVLKTIPKGKETISIGIPLIFDPAINFYREKDQLVWLNSVWRSETNSPLHDFYCLSQKDLSEFNRDSIEIIKTYPVTGNILARPKYPFKEIKTIFVKELNYGNESRGHYTVDENVEYAPGFSYIVNDSITPNKEAVIAFYAEVMAPDLNYDNLVMVLSFQDSKGELYSWQKAYVKDFIRNETDYFRANFTCVVPAAVKSGDEIKAYIWNPDKHLLNIRKQEFKWLSYYR